MKAISLFAGVGGICLGFKQANFDIVFANDIDYHTSLTYSLNFKHNLVIDDIKNIDTKNVSDADVVLFGFPCQSFSIAGNQKGLDDERGELFFEALRFIHDKQPKSFLLENVKNLISHDGGRTFRIILDALKNEGYYIRYQVLNACEYGNIPQNRERIYVVGFKDKQCADKFYFPDPVELTTSIGDIVKKNIKMDAKYYYGEKSKYYAMLKDSITKKDTIYQLRRIYVRENKSNLCPTLTANMGMGGHNVPLILDDFGIRKLTPKECFLFQGFPENYILPSNLADCHLYKQAGNSVCVPVVKAIALNINKALVD